MDRSKVWPDFRPEHILYEDEFLIAVHKPAGVPSQAAQPDRPDDLVTRLSRFLAARDGLPKVYLGVHQRLDRDTSGVVLFTKRSDVNAAIAAQFEGRTVEKRYLAAVSGKVPRSPKVTLSDTLRQGDDGRMEVLPRGARGKGQIAVTDVRVRERRGDRALLDLTLRTGRTHQARIQLAHAGSPIAGDALYGGARAPRLLLHAAELVVLHPRDKKKLTIRAEPPREMRAWLESGDRGAAVYDDVGAIAAALSLALEKRWGLGRSTEDPASCTTAFRLVSDEGDGLPGLAVDVYGEFAVAQLYAGDGKGPLDDSTRRDRVLDRLHALGFDGVYLKCRPKQANTLVDTRRDDLAPKLPVRGSPASDEIVIEEEGMPVGVRLGDGLSTGLFLDQRNNRRLVRSLSKGLRVANLFSYTCAFSVAAALGGAKRTVSVDASVVALERGRRNFELAGVPLGDAHTFVAEDAFAWLARMERKKESFDLVIVDPPSYSSSKKRRFVAESDYDDLVAAAVAVLGPRGRLIACCNHRGLSRAKFRRHVIAGVRAAKREAEQIKDLPDGSDFPAPIGQDVHMKSVLVTLRG